VNDNLPGVCATHCGCLFMVVIVGAWDVTPLCIWLCTIEVLVNGRRGHCVEMVDVFLYLVGIVMFVSGG
jgi:hypothetical protein